MNFPSRSLPCKQLHLACQCIVLIHWLWVVYLWQASWKSGIESAHLRTSSKVLGAAEWKQRVSRKVRNWISCNAERYPGYGCKCPCSCVALTVQVSSSSSWPRPWTLVRQAHVLPRRTSCVPIRSSISRCQHHRRPRRASCPTKRLLSRLEYWGRKPPGTCGYSGWNFSGHLSKFVPFSV